MTHLLRLKIPEYTALSGYLGARFPSLVLSYLFHCAHLLCLDSTIIAHSKTSIPAVQVAVCSILRLRILQCKIRAPWIFNAHNQAIVRPAQFATQCVTFWKCYIKLAHISKICDIKSLAKLGC